MERGSKTGVAVVGTGGVADQHIRALLGNERAELVGVVDVLPERAAAAARTAGGVRAATDLAQALAWSDVDAVVVCTPNDTHAAIALQIAAAGKHLLMEKPMTTTVADAQRVTAAFDDAGRVLMAAHTHRFNDYARAVKQEIDSGALGRPVFARLAILGGWIWPDWRHWVLDPQRSGGHALHNGVHLLDLVTWWLGAEPTRVYARGRHQTAAELRIWDYLEMTVDYDNGASAVCEMSRGHRPSGTGYRDVLVLGTDGVLTLPDDAAGSDLVTDQGTGQVPAAGTNGFAVQLAAWLDTIAGGPVLMTPAEGVRAVAMGVAVEESIASGRPVDLAGVPA